MEAKKYKTAKKLLLFVIVLLCTASGYKLYGIFRLPGEIYLTVGQTAELNSYAPVSFNIEPEAVAVVKQNDSGYLEENEDASVLDTSETGRQSMELSFLGIPVKKIAVDVIPETVVVPCGKTVGVQISAQGVTVLGLGSVTDPDGKLQKPAEGKVESGDVILSVNDIDLDSITELERIIQNSSGEVELRILRGGAEISERVIPVKDEKNISRLGIYTRDGTTGIGTMTYYNPETRKFGALGHGIMDINTKKLVTVKNGKILDSSITSVTKGKKGSPGELEGEISGIALGEIKANTPLGLYGLVTAGGGALPPESGKVRIALQTEVHEGPAVILSNVSGKEVKSYDIYIESVNRFNSDESKGMVLRITDQELLTKTNGIVQGMSGSPIIQDGKLIGAVTHVFVQNPAKGYGIFIENMLKQERSAMNDETTASLLQKAG